MNICGSVSFYCSKTVLSISSCVCFYVSPVPNIKYEYLCECVILLFVFQFSASVLVFVLSCVPGLSMNICVSVSFYTSCVLSSQHQFLCLFLC